jgi:TRAP-type C4-dicarboxylate transport system substrate-binding protein
MGRRRLLAIGIALCTVNFAEAQDSKPDPPKEWRLSTAVGPAFALGKAGARWASLIAEKSGGALAVITYPGAVLAQRDPERELLVLKEGGADLAVGSTLAWSAQASELAVVGLPWLAPQSPQLDALLAGAMKERLVAALDRAGVVALAMAPLGYRELATTSRAVHAPADLAGLKIRTTALPMLTELFAELRALPFAMSYADAQTALKSGALDGQDGSVAAFAAARLDAVGVRHVTLWGAVAEAAVFAVNRRVWDSWSDANRALVRGAADTAAQELAGLVRRETDAALADLAKRGIIVTRITPAGHDAFAAATRPVYAKWSAVAGEDLTRAAESAVKTALP